MPNRYGLYFKENGIFILKVYETEAGSPCDRLLYRKEFKTKKELDEYSGKQWFNIREVKR